ncbi:S9 family peptidase [Nafulsella turpanensis]|uniref:S9 family peptidase n=1 Tax=Nafulsella turpanensis TaxID=1265690 RepID=UPI00034DF85E|nr:prolyl oligopeptidase family serine peptidase [Nafulsella turpanensis]
MHNLFKSSRGNCLLYLLLGAVGITNAYSQTKEPLSELRYQTPPKAIADIIEAPETPEVMIDSKGKTMLLLEENGYPTIEEVSQPELRIAGLRINPATNGGSRQSYYSGIKVKNIASGKEYALKGLPENARISSVSWSPNEEYVAFTNTTNKGIELWIASLEDRTARPLTEAKLNDAYYGRPFAWQPDSKGLIYKSIADNRGERPEKSQAPEGPIVQENTGGVAPSRTYQDLLENRHDEALFDYYLTSQLKSTDLQGNSRSIGEPRLLRSFELSPNGEYILAEYIRRPYSYLVPSYRFPYTVEVWNQQGEVVKTIAEIPLMEKIPIARDAVPTGRRSVSWRSNAPAELYWAEALDKGDPENEVEFRDAVFMLPAPFEAEPEELVKTKNRYAGTAWMENDQAMVYERWWEDRKERRLLVNPDKPASEPVVLVDRSYEDVYNDPGYPVYTKNKWGQSVVMVDGNDIFLIAEGASPEGNRPFLNRFNLKTKETEQLWRSEAPYYEWPVDILNLKKGQILTRRESVDEVPNYFIRNFKNGNLEQITDFPHPYPQLQGIQKELVSYEREDGVRLSGTLYLPEGFKEGESEPLPLLLWAYPREYKSAKAAGQVKRSPYQFTRVWYGSPIFWVTQGYAVLDGAEMPIVGEGEEEPNDTFRKQLVANASAALDYLTERNIIDPERTAVGGHSYGAFMTANLLAHSDLFAAGIARSGAYNRTLTPFGFQNEQRTYWEAPEIYNAMSPFMHADKVNEPLLLIHGEADNNSGTFPIQSERYYNALKGHGAVSRLVFLPAESHGYQAKESIMHMLWEMDRWLDMYVKNKEVEE